MTIKSPLFTIVMANYNGGRYMEEAILSVLNQNCLDFELIIVDGGSSDNSLEIIKKYENRLGWWISEKDNGQSDAFNKGFSKAKGKYFFWLNTDDLLLPGSILSAKETIDKNPTCKWFAANTIFINDKNIILNCACGPKWYDFFIKKGVIYVYGPSSIFHKDLFIKAGKFDLNLHYTMDTDLWMRFNKMGFKFKRIHRYFWAFRIHIDSKTSHSFSSSPNTSFKEEQLFIGFKNFHSYSKWSFYKQFILKFVSGSFFFSIIDTLKYKGLNINKTKFK